LNTVEPEISTLLKLNHSLSAFGGDRVWSICAGTTGSVDVVAASGVSKRSRRRSIAKLSRMLVI